MEKKITIVAIALIATMICTCTGCSDKATDNTNTAAAKKDVIRVVLPESLKDKVDVHLYYENNAVVIKNNK